MMLARQLGEAPGYAKLKSELEFALPLPLVNRESPPLGLETAGFDLCYNSLSKPRISWSTLPAE